MVDDSSPLSKAGGSKEWCLLWFLLHYISVSVHRILNRVASIDIFLWFYFGSWIAVWNKVYVQSRFSVLSHCDLYNPENWAKSPGCEVRRNGSFPSAPQNHMNLNINETFMNHT